MQIISSSFREIPALVSASRVGHLIRKNSGHDILGFRIFSSKNANLTRSRKLISLVCNVSKKPGETSVIMIAEEWQWRETAKELAAYGALLIAVPVLPLLPRFEWSAAVYFLLLSLWSVYVGSHRSLGRRSTQKLSLKLGFAAPVLCSISLFGFYCLLRFFPDLDLRTFVSAYLTVAGVLAVANNLTNPLKLILPKQTRSLSWKCELPMLQEEGKPVRLTVSITDVLALFVGLSIAVASKQSGTPFTFNNLMAVCIVTELLQLLSLGSFTIAAVTLCGLLLYDVFWVFGSSQVFGDNVMMTVATSAAFDGPMKLVFPSWRAIAGNSHSILGLGDIAAPGLLIALMLRFDQSRSTLGNTPDKTYFITAITTYILGLITTIAANSVSGEAQPALLYLVPWLLVGLLLTAAYRGDTELLLNYKDKGEED